MPGDGNRSKASSRALAGATRPGPAWELCLSVTRAERALTTFALINSFRAEKHYSREQNVSPAAAGCLPFTGTPLGISLELL